VPEIRGDPISNHTVLVAPERQQRPNDFARARTSHAEVHHCPFCPGNEELTPDTVDQLSLAETASTSGGPWSVRVVPNLYSAVLDVDRPCTPATLQGTSPATPPTGWRTFSPAAGKHEVIIESRRHVLDFIELSDDEAELVFVAYQRRLEAIRQNPKLRFGIVFKNCGPRAGASMEHIHSQIIGLAEVPPAIQVELDSSRAYHQQNGTCIFCDLLANEKQLRSRIVDQNEHFTALCPPASRFNYELWILPNHHAPHFEDENDESLAAAARFLRQNLRHLHGLSSPANYNYLIHSAPFDSKPNDQYHWHIEVLPRLAQLAGFELGTGCFINTIPPEQAAQRLKSSSLYLT